VPVDLRGGGEGGGLALRGFSEREGLSRTDRRVLPQTRWPRDARPGAIRRRGERIGAENGPSGRHSLRRRGGWLSGCALGLRNPHRNALWPSRGVRSARAVSGIL